MVGGTLLGLMLPESLGLWVDRLFCLRTALGSMASALHFTYPIRQGLPGGTARLDTRLPACRQGLLARLALHAGEAWGMRFSNCRILISQTIRKLVRDKYGLNSDLIPNGVTLPEVPRSSSVLQKFGLAAGRYVLMVSRLVPEKRHTDLIEAFSDDKLHGWNVVFVGASEYPDAYAAAVAARAQATAGAVMAGYQSGLALRELYTHAGIFVLPSSHEGLPIALMEALSYGLPVVASDIPAHLEIGMDNAHYFP